MISYPVAAWKKLLSEGYTLIDVREPQEWSHGLLGNPVLLPLSVLREIGAHAHTGEERWASISEKMQLNDKESPLAVYCHSGIRSREACEILTELGFLRVVNLAGGIAAWNSMRAEEGAEDGRELC